MLILKRYIGQRIFLQLPNGQEVTVVVTDRAGQAPACTSQKRRAEVTENEYDWYHTGYMKGLFISMLFFAVFGMIPMISKIWYLENKVDRLQQQQTPAKTEAIP